MPRTPAYTLLLITRDRMVRADFASAGASESLSVVQRDRPESDDPFVLVGEMFGRGTAKPGWVFVLTTDCWTHSLSLAAANTGGMNDEELGKALAFEAEPLSGVNAFDALAGIVPLGTEGGERRFWFSEVATHIRDQFDEAIRAAGGRLAGICHPAGVSLPLEVGSPDAAWRRIEIWPNAICRARYQGATLTYLRIDDTLAPGRGRDVQLEAARKETPLVEREELLVAEAAADGWASGGATPISLLDEVTQKLWLTQWLRTLTASKPNVPLIRPAARTLSKQHCLLIGAGLALFLAVCCFGHHVLVNLALAAAAAEKVQLEAPGQEIAAIGQQVTALETELKKLKEEHGKLNDNVEFCEKSFDSQRQRLTQLLRHIAADQPRGWVLRRIEGDGRELKLHGVMVHPRHIGSLVRDLSGGLSSVGWGVEPPEQEAQNQLADGGPWTFQLKLRDALTPPAATAAATRPIVQSPVAPVPLNN